MDITNLTKKQHQNGILFYPGNSYQILNHFELRFGNYEKKTAVCFLYKKNCYFIHVFLACFLGCSVNLFASGTAIAKTKSSESSNTPYYVINGEKAQIHRNESTKETYLELDLTDLNLKTTKFYDRPNRTVEDKKFPEFVAEALLSSFGILISSGDYFHITSIKKALYNDKKILIYLNSNGSSTDDEIPNLNKGYNLTLFKLEEKNASNFFLRSNSFNIQKIDNTEKTENGNDFFILKFKLKNPQDGLKIITSKKDGKIYQTNISEDSINFEKPNDTNGPDDNKNYTEEELKVYAKSFFDKNPNVSLNLRSGDKFLSFIFIMHSMQIEKDVVTCVLEKTSPEVIPQAILNAESNIGYLYIDNIFSAITKGIVKFSEAFLRALKAIPMMAYHLVTDPKNFFINTEKTIVNMVTHPVQTLENIVSHPYDLLANIAVGMLISGGIGMLKDAAAAAEDSALTRLEDPTAEGGYNNNMLGDGEDPNIEPSDDPTKLDNGEGVYSDDDFNGPDNGEGYDNASLGGARVDSFSEFGGDDLPSLGDDNEPVLPSNSEKGAPPIGLPSKIANFTFDTKKDLYVGPEGNPALVGINGNEAVIASFKSFNFVMPETGLVLVGEAAETALRGIVVDGSGELLSVQTPADIVQAAPYGLDINFLNNFTLKEGQIIGPDNEPAIIEKSNQNGEIKISSKDGKFVTMATPSGTGEAGGFFYKSQDLSEGGSLSPGFDLKGSTSVLPNEPAQAILPKKPSLWQRLKRFLSRSTSDDSASTLTGNNFEYQGAAYRNSLNLPVRLTDDISYNPETGVYESASGGASSTTGSFGKYATKGYEPGSTALPPAGAQTLVKTSTGETIQTVSLGDGSFDVYRLNGEGEYEFIGKNISGTFVKVSDSVVASAKTLPHNFDLGNLTVGRIKNIIVNPDDEVVQGLKVEKGILTNTDGQPVRIYKVGNNGLLIESGETNTLIQPDGNGGYTVKTGNPDIDSRVNLDNLEGAKEITMKQKVSTTETDEKLTIGKLYKRAGVSKPYVSEPSVSMVDLSPQQREFAKQGINFIKNADGQIGTNSLNLPEDLGPLKYDPKAQAYVLNQDFVDTLSPEDQGYFGKNLDRFRGKNAVVSDIDENTKFIFSDHGDITLRKLGNGSYDVYQGHTNFNSDGYLGRSGPDGFKPKSASVQPSETLKPAKYPMERGLRANDIPFKPADSSSLESIVEGIKNEDVNAIPKVPETPTPPEVTKPTTTPTVGAKPTAPVVTQPAEETLLPKAKNYVVGPNGEIGTNIYNLPENLGLLKYDPNAETYVLNQDFIDGLPEEEQDYYSLKETSYGKGIRKYYQENTTFIYSEHGIVILRDLGDGTYDVYTGWNGVDGNERYIGRTGPDGFKPKSESVKPSKDLKPFKYKVNENGTPTGLTKITFKPVDIDPKTFNDFSGTLKAYETTDATGTPLAAPRPQNTITLDNKTIVQTPAGLPADIPGFSLNDKGQFVDAEGKLAKIYRYGQTNDTWLVGDDGTEVLLRPNKVLTEYRYVRGLTREVFYRNTPDIADSVESVPNNPTPRQLLYTIKTEAKLISTDGTEIKLPRGTKIIRDEEGRYAAQTPNGQINAINESEQIVTGDNDDVIIKKSGTYDLQNPSQVDSTADPAKGIASSDEPVTDPSAAKTGTDVGSQSSAKPDGRSVNFSGNSRGFSDKVDEIEAISTAGIEPTSDNPLTFNGLVRVVDSKQPIEIPQGSKLVYKSSGQYSITDAAGSPILDSSGEPVVLKLNSQVLKGYTESQEASELLPKNPQSFTIYEDVTLKVQGEDPVAIPKGSKIEAISQQTYKITTPEGKEYIVNKNAAKILNKHGSAYNPPSLPLTIKADTQLFNQATLINSGTYQLSADGTYQITAADGTVTTVNEDDYILNFQGRFVKKPGSMEVGEGYVTSAKEILKDSTDFVIPENSKLILTDGTKTDIEAGSTYNLKDHDPMNPASSEETWVITKPNGETIDVPFDAVIKDKDGEEFKSNDSFKPKGKKVAKKDNSSGTPETQPSPPKLDNPAEVTDDGAPDVPSTGETPAEGIPLDKGAPTPQQVLPADNTFQINGKTYNPPGGLPKDIPGFSLNGEGQFVDSEGELADITKYDSGYIKLETSLETVYLKPSGNSFVPDAEIAEIKPLTDEAQLGISDEANNAVSDSDKYLSNPTKVDNEPEEVNQDSSSSGRDVNDGYLEVGDNRQTPLTRDESDAAYADLEHGLKKPTDTVSAGATDDQSSLSPPKKGVSFSANNTIIDSPGTSEIDTPGTTEVDFKEKDTTEIGFLPEDGNPIDISFNLHNTAHPRVTLIKNGEQIKIPLDSKYELSGNSYQIVTPDGKIYTVDIDDVLKVNIDGGNYTLIDKGSFTYHEGASISGRNFFKVPDNSEIMYQDGTKTSVQSGSFYQASSRSLEDSKVVSKYKIVQPDGTEIDIPEDATIQYTDADQQTQIYKKKGSFAPTVKEVDARPSNVTVETGTKLIKDGNLTVIPDGSKYILQDGQYHIEMPDGEVIPIDKDTEIRTNDKIIKEKGSDFIDIKDKEIKTTKPRDRDATAANERALRYQRGLELDPDVRTPAGLPQTTNSYVLNEEGVFVNGKTGKVPELYMDTKGNVYFVEGQKEFRFIHEKAIPDGKGGYSFTSYRRPPTKDPAFKDDLAFSKKMLRKLKRMKSIRNQSVVSPFPVRDIPGFNFDASKGALVDQKGVLASVNKLEGSDNKFLIRTKNTSVVATKSEDGEFTFTKTSTKYNFDQLGKTITNDIGFVKPDEPVFKTKPATETPVAQSPFAAEKPHTDQLMIHSETVTPETSSPPKLDNPAEVTDDGAPEVPSTGETPAEGIPETIAAEASATNGGQLVNTTGNIPTDETIKPKLSKTKVVAINGVKGNTFVLKVGDDIKESLTKAINDVSSSTASEFTIEGAKFKSLTLSTATERQYFLVLDSATEDSVFADLEKGTVLTINSGYVVGAEGEGVTQIASSNIKGMVSNPLSPNERLMNAIKSASTEDTSGLAIQPEVSSVTKLTGSDTVGISEVPGAKELARGTKFVLAQSDVLKDGVFSNIAKQLKDINTSTDPISTGTEIYLSDDQTSSLVSLDGQAAFVVTKQARTGVMSQFPVGTVFTMNEDSVVGIVSKSIVNSNISPQELVHIHKIISATNFPKFTGIVSPLGNSAAIGF